MMIRSRLLALAAIAAACLVPSQVVLGRALPPAAAQTANVAGKAPAVVFIIRHGEKPLGDDKVSDLAPAGFKRADALPSLFLQQPGSSRLPRLPRPSYLFATDTSKHSNRPIETITPLSQALHLALNHDYADREAPTLAKEVLSGKYAGKVVLICWHHGEIPHLAQSFGVTDAPKKWDDTVYDKIWMIEWMDGKPQFSVLPENLLPGDSTN
jgi:hypothetical protein